MNNIVIFNICFAIFNFVMLVAIWFVNKGVEKSNNQATVMLDDVIKREKELQKNAADAMQVLDEAKAFNSRAGEMDVQSRETLAEAKRLHESAAVMRNETLEMIERQKKEIEKLTPQTT